MSETLRDLVVSLSLNSDNFTRNIKSINKQIQEAESAFRLASAGVENFETTTAGLSSKLSTLQRTFQLQQDTVGQYERALQQAGDKLQECYARQNDYAQRLVDAKDKPRGWAQTARHELTMTMVRDVLYNTGVTATAGIGTNLFLAKIAMDIEAKKSKPDKDGVRIAALDEMTFREKLWTHRPLTDFWRIGKGISQKLEAMQLFTLGDVARASLDPYCEGRLYKTFGVNAELIIDHAWGWEPVTVEDIRQYRPSTSSISSGQVLQCPYDFEKGRLIVREMTELLVLDLVRKHVVTKQIVLDIGYDRESLEGERGRKYAGPVVTDPYGRKIPKAAHGTGNMDGYTSSTHVIMSAVLDVYDRVVHKDLLIRRVNVTACNLVSETEIPEDKPEQLDMFTDYEALEQEKKARQLAEEKERRLQNVTLAIQDKFGKNAMLKGMNLMEGGTTIARNGQIGGHKAGDE